MRERATPSANPAPSAGRLFIFALCCCIALGIACRFVGLNWDADPDFQFVSRHLHPDERFLCLTTSKLHWPVSIRDYFETARAPLNPLNSPGVSLFVYGQLPLFLTKAVAAALGRDNYDDIVLVGRAFSALFDSGSVLLIFLIGRRIGGVSLGALAAALLALSPLHIQQSHFFTVDSFATFFLLASFSAALRWRDAQRQNARTSKQTPAFIVHPSSFIVGCCWGAALACKISSLLFLPVILLFVLARRRSRSADERRAMWTGAALLFLAALLTFRIAHPMAFEGAARPATLWGFLDVRPIQARPDGRTFWQSLNEQKAITNGTRDVPFNVQWIGRRDFVYPPYNWLGWGTGWPLGIAGLGGIGLVLWCAMRRRNEQAPPPPFGLIVAALWTLFVFGFYGAQFSKFTRYLLPATPFLCLCAASLLERMKDEAGRVNRTKRIACLLPPASCFLLTLLWAVAVTSIYTREHTRVAASRWIRANIARGTPVAMETAWDDALPLGGPAGLQVLDLKLYDRDDAAKRAHLINTLDRAQWIFVSSQRAWASIPRWPKRWPLTTAYYSALFSGRLGFVADKEWTSYPQIFGVQFPDDNFEESLSVYDHPRVVLFRKTPSWSRARAAAILDERLLRDVSDATPPRAAAWLAAASGAPLPQLPSPRVPLP